MNRLPITRAAHVIGFCDEFRSIGISVESELEKARLPANLEEHPDAYVNNIFATTFVGRTASDQGIEDIGWLGAKAFRESQLSASLLDAMSPTPTVLSRLKSFFVMSGIEDSHLRLEMTALGENVQIVSNMAIPEDTPGMDASNWTQVAVVIEVIRSVAGPNWTPSTMTFKTEFDLCDDAKEAFGNTRLITGASNTSVIFPRDVLSLRAETPGREKSMPFHNKTEMSELDCMRSLLQPYLHGKPPRIAEAAEIYGTTVRTLQRRLRDHGTSYGEMVETTRFEIAADLLTMSDRRLIDVAVAVGFEDQANFGRMFRKYAGTSPGKYRRAQQLAA